MDYEKCAKSLKYFVNTLKIRLIERCHEGCLGRCAIIGPIEVSEKLLVKFLDHNLFFCSRCYLIMDVALFVKGLMKTPIKHILSGMLENV